jgi:hypothetical protein
MTVRPRTYLNRIVAVVLTLVALSSGLSRVWAEPALEVIQDERTPRPGKPYHLVCEVTWHGDPGDYAILPAEVDPFDWGTATVTASKAFTRDGQNVVSQTIAIVPAEPGEYTSPEISVPYIPPEVIPPPDQPEPPAQSEARETLPQLRAGTFPFQVLPDATPIWLSGILGGILAVAVVVGWVMLLRKFRPSRDEEAPPAAAIDVDGVRATLQLARQRRVEGDFYGFYQNLNRAGAAVEPAGSALTARLEARAQEVGYRGARPTDVDMDGDVKEVECALRVHEQETADALDRV